MAGTRTKALALWGRSTLRWLAAKILRSRTPRWPLRFVCEQRQTFWSVARNAGGDGTNVHSQWYVTNVSTRPIVLVYAWLGSYQAEFARVFTRDHDGAPFREGLPIAASSTATVAATYTFAPAICADREILVADVVFEDDRGRRHRIRSVRFPYMGS